MKLRATFMLFFTAATFALIAFPTFCRAVTFPMIYEGTVHVTNNMQSGGGCAGDAQMQIILYANGTLKVSTDANILLGPTTCTVISTTDYGWPWWSREGTWDESGTFSVDMDGVPVAGTFNDTAISGSGSFSDSYQTRAYSFTLPILDRSPKITLEPSTYPEFQMNILEKKGFTIKIRKEDGVKDSKGNWKLNLSTLIFATDGVDNSQNFIDTAANQGIVSVTVSEKEILITIIPDPRVFMTEQNVFNILSNGEHVIGLQVCDTEGRCGTSVYSIYFGPFAFVGSVMDKRCTEEGPYLDIGKFALGNMGHASPTAALYVALINAENPDDYWCLSTEGPFLVWRQLNLVPLAPVLSLPEAEFITADHIPLDLSYAHGVYQQPGNDESYPFPGGLYRFVVLVIDYYSGANKGDAKDVLTCDLHF